jgi:endo-1,4-beta-xylanase
MNKLANKLIIACLIIAAGILLVQCGASKNSQASSPKGLKDYYKNYFYVGVAVSPQGLRRADESKLIVEQFNSITPENAMKMGPIHPQEKQYNWADADSIVAFAKRNNIMARGHTLCWHSQAPAWMFIDSSMGKRDTVSKQKLFERLREHIHTVVSRYKGSIYAWDVVNEVISDSPNEYFRNSQWYRICGEEFVDKAFIYAREADPNALLFYNDYNETNPVKREKIYRLVKSMKDRGIPIDGIGLQCHWGMYDITEGKIDSTLKKFADLGLKIQITELDLKVQRSGNGPAARDTIRGYTAEREKVQTEAYDMIFRVFRKYKDAIQSVTFWNVSDRASWLDRGGKAYPLLFDTTYQPKKAYYGVVDFKK